MTTLRVESVHELHAALHVLWDSECYEVAILPDWGRLWLLVAEWKTGKWHVLIDPTEDLDENRVPGDRISDSVMLTGVETLASIPGTGPATLLFRLELEADEIRMIREGLAA